MFLLQRYEKKHFEIHEYNKKVDAKDPQFVVLS